MTNDELRGTLTDRGVIFSEKAVQNGIRFDCKSGEIFMFSTAERCRFRVNRVPLWQMR